MFYRFDGKTPQIGAGTYVSPTATIIGDVTVGDRCYIGHGAILRGDYGSIVVGNQTAIEEGAIIHAPPDESCIIGDGVVIGHGAIVHASSIGTNVGIGMGAILSIRSIVGQGAVVAEGAVVKQQQAITELTVVGGNPAKKIKDVLQKDVDFWRKSRKIYVDLAEKYLRVGMERIEV